MLRRANRVADRHFKEHAQFVFDVDSKGFGGCEDQFAHVRHDGNERVLSRHDGIDLGRVIFVDGNVFKAHEGNADRFRVGEHDLFGIRDLLLHKRLVQSDAERLGIVLRLFDLLGGCDAIIAQNRFERTASVGVGFALPGDFSTKAMIVFRFSFGVGEAEHRFGELVEERLRFLDIVSRGKLADIGV